MNQIILWSAQLDIPHFTALYLADSHLCATATFKPVKLENNFSHVSVAHSYVSMVVGESPTTHYQDLIIPLHPLDETKNTISKRTYSAAMSYLGKFIASQRDSGRSIEDLVDLTHYNPTLNFGKLLTLGEYLTTP